MSFRATFCVINADDLPPLQLTRNSDGLLYIENGESDVVGRRAALSLALQMSGRFASEGKANVVYCHLLKRSMFV
jgi:hypothetical protein